MWDGLYTAYDDTSNLLDLMSARCRRLLSPSAIYGLKWIAPHRQPLRRASWLKVFGYHTRECSLLLAVTIAMCFLESTESKLLVAAWESPPPVSNTLSPDPCSPHALCIHETMCYISRSVSYRCVTRVSATHQCTLSPELGLLSIPSCDQRVQRIHQR